MLDLTNCLTDGNSYTCSSPPPKKNPKKEKKKSQYIDQRLFFLKSKND